MERDIKIKINWLGERLGERLGNKLGEKHLNGTINGGLSGTIKKLKEKDIIEYRGSKKSGGYFVKSMEVKS